MSLCSLGAVLIMLMRMRGGNVSRGDNMVTRFSWSRKCKDGYEVSSVGDKRFSAFYAKMPDGRSLEMHYQCDVKGYDVGGHNWRKGKGNPSLRHNDNDDLYEDYLSLWKQYFSQGDLLQRMFNYLVEKDVYVLTDCFASTDINQARAISDLLNEEFLKLKEN